MTRDAVIAKDNETRNDRTAILARAFKARLINTCSLRERLDWWAGERIWRCWVAVHSLREQELNGVMQIILFMKARYFKLGFRTEAGARLLYWDGHFHDSSRMFGRWAMITEAPLRQWQVLSTIKETVSENDNKTQYEKYLAFCQWRILNQNLSWLSKRTL